MKVKRSEATQWTKSSVNEELNGMWMIDGNNSYIDFLTIRGGVWSAGDLKEW